MSINRENKGNISKDTTGEDLENRPQAIKETLNSERKSTEYPQDQNNKTGLVLKNKQCILLLNEKPCYVSSNFSPEKSGSADLQIPPPL